MLVDLSDDVILGIATDGKAIEQRSTQTGEVETSSRITALTSGTSRRSRRRTHGVGLMAFLRSRDITFQLPE